MLAAVYHLIEMVVRHLFILELASLLSEVGLCTAADMDLVKVKWLILIRLSPLTCCASSTTTLTLNKQKQLHTRAIHFKHPTY